MPDASASSFSSTSASFPSRTPTTPITNVDAPPTLNGSGTHTRARHGPPRSQRARILSLSGAWARCSWWEGVFSMSKVPFATHCGFAQFVRRADAFVRTTDAERAMETLRIPVGGSRIRVGWARSQHTRRRASSPGRRRVRRVRHLAPLAMPAPVHPRPERAPPGESTFGAPRCAR
ncbi:hypothetical protein C8J57DRAFT_418456 [Mycena rebaudengoi]|nr:hypothetical protein C8J57DRAFT_418456 [Mycena rebaudengoi]